MIDPSLPSHLARALGKKGWGGKEKVKHTNHIHAQARGPWRLLLFLQAAVVA